MSLSIYEMESEQEGTSGRNPLIDITSAVVTMTASFIFCSFFVSLMLNGNYHGLAFILFTIIKGVLVVGVMLVLAALVAFLFQKAMTRRLNSMLLGIVLAFLMIFFNI